MNESKQHPSQAKEYTISVMQCLHSVPIFENVKDHILPIKITITVTLITIILNSLLSQEWLVIYRAISGYVFTVIK